MIECRIPPVFVVSWFQKKTQNKSGISAHKIQGHCGLIGTRLVCTYSILYYYCRKQHKIPHAWLQHASTALTTNCTLTMEDKELVAVRQ